MANPPRHGGGWCNPAKLPKGENGRALCRQCKTEVPKGRRTFCGQPCVDEWSIRSNPGFAARKVEARDKGVCVHCGLDCTDLLERLQRIAEFEIEHLRGPNAPVYMWLHKQHESLPAFTKLCNDIELPKHLRRLDRRLWEMDHIIPVAEGGGSCGLENLRTLCFACHRIETTKLVRRLAAAKKVANG